MGRPDPRRIQAQARVVLRDNGETALWRAYVSASAGIPKFGLGPGYTYTERLMTGLFQRIEPRETDGPGGQTQAAQFGVTTEFPVGARDEVVWNGTAYRLDGNPTPVHLGGRVLWRSPLAMAQATG